jgi:hypothetical protein
MPVIETKLDLRSEAFSQNRSQMLETLDELDELLAQAARGGGEETLAACAHRQGSRAEFAGGIPRSSRSVAGGVAFQLRRRFRIHGGGSVECVITRADPQCAPAPSTRSTARADARAKSPNQPSSGCQSLA